MPALFLSDAGAEATELVTMLGHDPAHESLSQLFDSAAVISSGLQQFQIISRQTHWLGGKTIALMLLQKTRPALVIATEEVR